MALLRRIVGEWSYLVHDNDAEDNNAMMRWQMQNAACEQEDEKGKRGSPSQPPTFVPEGREGEEGTSSRTSG